MRCTRRWHCCRLVHRIQPCLRVITVSARHDGAGGDFEVALRVACGPIHWRGRCRCWCGSGGSCRCSASRCCWLSTWCRWSRSGGRRRPHAWVLAVGSTRRATVDGDAPANVGAAVAVAGARHSTGIVHQSAVCVVVSLAFARGGVRAGHQIAQAFHAHLLHSVGGQNEFAVGCLDIDGVGGAGARTANVATVAEGQEPAHRRRLNLCHGRPLGCYPMQSLWLLWKLETPEGALTSCSARWVAGDPRACAARWRPAFRRRPARRAPGTWRPWPGRRRPRLA